MRWLWVLLTAIWFTFLSVGVASIPALGPLLDLHSGVWSYRVFQQRDMQLPGLEANVQVAWDKSGVPHIFAQSESDLYLAHGFVMASQRLFQMDLSTRQPMGRLSEWVGSRTQKMDHWQVLFGMRESIRKTTQVFLADPKQKMMIESFVRGVNAFIQTGHLPIEYRVLRAQPEFFTSERVVAMDKALTYSLAGRSAALKLTRLQQRLSAEKVLDLFPEFLPDAYEDYIDPRDHAKARRQKESPSDFSFVSHLKDIPDLPLPHSAGKGSNNWALSPRKSETGHSVFANDTHLGYSLPNIWYENQLSAPGFNVYGVSLIAVPGIVNGFNWQVAWGPTNGTTPVLDFYEIEFENETSLRYRYQGQWLEPTLQREQILIRSSASESLDVVWTRLGVLLHREGRYGLVANWMGHRPGQELRAFSGLYTAQTYKECLNSFAQFWKVPIQNFICADGDHIGWLHAGRIPYRRIGEGRLIMSGSQGNDPFQDELPENLRPQADDPAQGYLLSANQKVEGPSYPGYLGWDYEEPFRAIGIRRELQAKEKLNVEDMMRIQNSSLDIEAEKALPLMLALLNEADLSKEQKTAVDQLRHWDFKDRAEQTEPSLFKAWFSEFHSRVAENVKPRSMRTLWLIERLSKNPQDSDRQWLKQPLPAEIQDSFQTAWKTLAERFGSDPSRWVWRRYNAIQIPHIARLPGWGSEVLPIDGSGESVRGAHTQYGPVYKAVAKLGPQPQLWIQVPGGNEGDPLSLQYGRFVAEWARGEMREVEYYSSLEEARKSGARIVTLKAVH